MTDPRHLPGNDPYAARVARDPLAGVALVLVIAHVVILVVMAIGQPIAFGSLASGGDPTVSIATISALSQVVQIVSLLVALAALIVGLVALRRPRVSRLIAGIAIGVGGASVISGTAAAVGGFIGAAIQAVSF